MKQYTFSSIRADEATIAQIAAHVFAGSAPEIADAAARRLVALWNRFVYVPTEALEPEVCRLTVGAANVGAFCAWERKIRNFYPERLVDHVAMNRLIGLFAEAELVYAAMPVATVKLGTEAT